MADINTHSRSEMIDAIHAARSGDLIQAKLLFEKSLREGNNSAKLFYNLGVIYYRLKLYREAKETFLTLTKINKLNELACYNIALIEVRLKNEKSALKWLDKIIENVNYKKMHGLALTLKYKLENKAEYSQLPNRKTFATGYNLSPLLTASKVKINIKTEFGYNDNIAQYRYIKKRLSKQPGDSYVYLQIDSKVKLSRHVNFEASTFYMAYQKKSYFDNINVLSFVNYSNRILNWHYRIDGGYARQNSNGIDYQEIVKLGVSLFGELANNVQYYSELSDDIINSLDKTYMHLGGMRYLWLQKIIYYRNMATYSFSYQNEINQRKNFRSNDGNSFSSFSAKVHRVEALISTKINRTLKTDLFVGAEYLYHSKNNIIFGKEMDRRQDIETHFGFNLTYKIKKQAKVFAKYRRSINESTLKSYRYKNTIYQFGLIWNY